VNIDRYLASINQRLQSGISREHSYRGDLEALIRTLVPDVNITNEPANVTDCGNPDYVITKGDIPIGFIEAKDIGKDLNSKANKEQFDRYRKALDNLIITDYIWFQFFQNGELVHEIRIAEIEDGNLSIKPETFAEFTGLVQNFCTYIGNTIKSPKKLASMMAAKARLLQVILEKAITTDEENQGNTELQQQYATFKSILIHDLTPAGFADIYAQTLAYGMFAARLHDDTLDTFSRQEAIELIPKSNLFLRKLFNHVAGADIDERIKTTVDNLADVFRATDVKALLKNFGKATQTHDPIIHFYETFLAEYDAKLRKARGVWYTPEPVVNFIVRGVDEILKSEFGLKDGLADTAKTTIEVEVQGAAVSKGRNKGKAITQSKEVHKVQVLDPATGTGTFLAEVVKFIYNGKFKSMQGAWSSYVDEHLIPRLNGFELLMASYAMAHLKLDMLLRETGFKASKNQRLNIYLTNSLEENHPDTGTLFSTWLSTEANEANYIKRDTPVMVVLGNPPYSGESANKGDWIMKLMEDYKKEPGGKEKLKERNPKWVNDDYVKFLRYGQHFIEKNGEGILAFINPHGFLDNPTFRGMRWNLLKTYDKIYTIDLHGNSKKKETAPDGSKDENVFDIMQGVAITFFVKHAKPAHQSVTPAKAGVHKGIMDSRLRGNDESLAEVYHFDLYGKRQGKYDFLWQNSLQSIPFEKLPNASPMYFMVSKDFEAEKAYNKSFSLKQLFNNDGLGITTAHDSFVINKSKSALIQQFEEFKASTRNEELLHNKFAVKKKAGWNILEGWDNIKNETNLSKYVHTISYRPFDKRFIFFEDKLVWRAVRKVMNHFIVGDNIAIVCVRRSRDGSVLTPFLTTSVTDKSITSSLDNANIFPLYLYPEGETQGGQQNLDISLRSSANSASFAVQKPKRTPNLDPNILSQIAQGLGLTFTPEKEMDSRLRGNDEGVEHNKTNNTFAPIDLLDYIYAVLHSPNYRETYKEFLKVDFPRIPYPQDAAKFWQLVTLGGELRQIHLLESPKVEESISTFEGDGDNYEVTSKLSKKDVKIYGEESSGLKVRVPINDEKYFDNIPLIAWEFYIGGYQPAQKWLKDRRGRKLSFDDIQHYQKIITALMETHRIMQAIDEVGVMD